MASLKVLIIGGGIAGPALAHWLSRIGANVTLIERSPEMRASGQQVDLRAQGVPMMKKMGIEAGTDYFYHLGFITFPHNTFNIHPALHFRSFCILSYYQGYC